MKTLTIKKNLIQNKTLSVKSVVTFLKAFNLLLQVNSLAIPASKSKDQCEIWMHINKAIKEVSDITAYKLGIEELANDLGIQFSELTKIVLKGNNLGPFLQEKLLKMMTKKELKLNCHFFPTNLMHLDISKNNIDSIYMIKQVSLTNKKIVGMFRFLTNLRTLDLSHNDLTEIHPDTFKSNKKLTVMKVSHNKLSTKLRCFAMIPQLEILDLSFNKIESFNDAFKYFTKFEQKNLTEVNLLGNDIAQEQKDISKLNILFSTATLITLPKHKSYLKRKSFKKNTGLLDLDVSKIEKTFNTRQSAKPAKRNNIPLTARNRPSLTQTRKAIKKHLKQEEEKEKSNNQLTKTPRNKRKSFQFGDNRPPIAKKTKRNSLQQSFIVDKKKKRKGRQDLNASAIFSSPRSQKSSQSQKTNDKDFVDLDSQSSQTERKTKGNKKIRRRSGINKSQLSKSLKPPVSPPQTSVAKKTRKSYLKSPRRTSKTANGKRLNKNIKEKTKTTAKIVSKKKPTKNDLASVKKGTKEFQKLFDETNKENKKPKENNKKTKKKEITKEKKVSKSFTSEDTQAEKSNEKDFEIQTKRNLSKTDVEDGVDYKNSEGQNFQLKPQIVVEEGKTYLKLCDGVRMEIEDVFKSQSIDNLKDLPLVI